MNYRRLHQHNGAVPSFIAGLTIIAAMFGLAKMMWDVALWFLSIL